MTSILPPFFGPLSSQYSPPFSIFVSIASDVFDLYSLKLVKHHPDSPSTYEQRLADVGPHLRSHAQ